MAVLLITHDLGVIASFAEDVLVMYAGAPVELGPVEDVFARAGHPYTQALIAAVPQLGDARAEALPSIPGVLPRADAIPPGCRFAPRCRLAGGRDICRSERPAFDPADPAARVACHFTEESRATAGGHPPAGDLPRRARRSAARCSRSTTSPRTTARAAPALASGWLRAVESVCFAIRSGESLGLVGESGSGKSTVARLLLGLTQRTRGTVVFEGRALEASSGGIAKEHRGRVQMVFQDPGDSLNPLMTIEQIVAEPLLLLHRRQAKQQRGRVPAAARARRPRGGLRQAATAPALGRPAAARRDRAGARHRPGARRLRRGRLVARRLGARADPQSADATCSGGSASPTSSSRTTSRRSAMSATASP